MKIQTKISSIIFTLILATGIITIVTIAFVSKQMIEAEVYAYLENMAISRAKHVETLFDEHQDVVEILATESIFIKTVTSPNPQRIARLQQRIKNIVQVDNHISRIRVLDKNGDVVASSHLHLGIDTAGNAEIFAYGKESLYVRDIHISMMTGTKVFSISAPMKMNGEFIGIVIANIEVESRLYQITTNQTGLYNTGEIYLINKDRYMITPSRFLEDTFLKLKTDSSEARECFTLSKEEHKQKHGGIDIYENYRGVLVLGTHQMIDSIDWCLLAEIDAKEAFAPINRLIQFMLLLFVVLLGIGSLLAFFIAENITNPILKLQRRAYEIEKGNWNYQITVDTQDEIGQFSNAFDSMTTRLKNAQEELQCHKANLENQVAERTAELSQRLLEIEQQKNSIQKLAIDLEINQQRYENLVNSIEGIVWEADAKTFQFTFVSQQAERLTGYPIKEWRQQPDFWVKHLHPDDQRWAVDYCIKSTQNKEDYNFEYRMITADNHTIWLKDLVKVIVENDQAVKICGVMFDITESKRLETNLQTLSEKLEIRVKERTAQLQQEIVERKQIEIKLKQYQDNLEVLVKERTAELKQANEQLQAEIAERKEAEKALRHSEEQFRKMFEEGPIGMVIVETDFRISKVNSAFCKMLGYTKAELVGRTIADVSYPEDMPRNNKFLQQALTGKITFYQMEKRYVRKDGQLVWGNLASSFFYDEQGNILYFLAKIEDITKRKQAENDIIQAKNEAESANRAKSEFLANMSHEIRTPMNAVIGFSDILASKITDKKQKNYLNTIQTAGKSLLTLINDILDLSKIEAGRLEIQYEPLDPRGIFTELQQIFSLKIAEKNLEFILNIEESLPSSLFLDETRVRQILLNLIGNAIKFTESGYIKLCAHHIPDNNSQVDLILAVEDSGIGIPADQQDLIFESFRQQDGQSTRKYGGTGLGLAITKRLAEIMNGQISVISNPGKGSRFEIILHQTKVAVTEPMTQSTNYFNTSNITFEKVRILVVDDIESNRELIKEYLSQVNLEVIGAENGQEALLFAEEYQPALILMDIRMPKMNGYEATTQLKNNPNTTTIPVIALTATVGLNEKAKIETHGFAGFLTKPVAISELLCELSHYLKYTQKTDTTVPPVAPPVVESTLNLAAITNLPKLKNQIKQEIIPTWEKTNIILEMDIVAELAERIIELGKEYHLPVFIQFGEPLLECSQTFDIAHIQKAIKELPVLIKPLMGDGE